MTTLSQKRAAAGRAGGLSTLKKYGVEHFQRLGKWGAHVLHATYRLEPCDLNDFALVHKEMNVIKAYLSGKPIR